MCLSGVSPVQDVFLISPRALLLGECLHISGVNGGTPFEFQGLSLSWLPSSQVNHEEPALRGNLKELVPLNSVQGVQ